MPTQGCVVFLVQHMAIIRHKAVAYTRLMPTQGCWHTPHPSLQLGPAGIPCMLGERAYTVHPSTASSQPSPPPYLLTSHLTSHTEHHTKIHLPSPGHCARAHTTRQAQIPHARHTQHTLRTNTHTPHIHTRTPRRTLACSSALRPCSLAMTTSVPVSAATSRCRPSTCARRIRRCVGTRMLWAAHPRVPGLPLGVRGYMP